MSISVVVNTKNMATTIGAAIESVAHLADEVIVVDMNSQDDTVAVAKKLGAEVFSYKEDLGFADPARNFALSKAQNDWILVLDADEEISSQLVQELKKIVMGKISPDLVGDCYFIARQNMIFNHAFAQTGWWPDYQLRFFKKGMVQWTDQVHTLPVATGKIIQLPADPQLAILHHNYQTVTQFIERLNRYTTLELTKMNPAEQDFTADELMKSFSSEFFRRLFKEKGFADGLHGLSLSFLQSFYQLTVFLKEWQQVGFQDKTSASEILQALQTFQKDFNYWMADWQVQHSTGWKKIYWQLQRRRATSK